MLTIGRVFPQNLAETETFFVGLTSQELEQNRADAAPAVLAGRVAVPRLVISQSDVQFPEGSEVGKPSLHVVLLPRSGVGVLVRYNQF